MRIGLAAVFAVAVLATSVRAQDGTEKFQLAPSKFKQHYAVGAANGDPNARTLPEIAAVNMRLAENGDVKAAFELGLAYLQGYGVPQDPAKAEHWLAIGAVTPDDQELLASMYRDGDYLPQNAAKADFWFRKAGRPGDLLALAQMYQSAQPSQVGKAAPIYQELLTKTGAPEVRRAQIELGVLVLDGKYSAGNNPTAQALNLQWARSIAQELLGQSEYDIASDFEFGREGVPHDHAMWVRFCERAAAYNIDLAQEFLGKAMLQGQIPGATPTEGYAWIKLASDKRYEDRKLAQSLAEKMTAEEKLSAEALIEALTETKQTAGAYYRSEDPLRTQSEAALVKMQSDDPDVELRRAFSFEQEHTPESYTKALALYRDIRDNSHRAAMAVLGQSYLHGDNGLPPNPTLAQLWLQRSAREGFKPAALLLAH